MKNKARIASNGQLLFKCPGCGREHAVNVAGDIRPKWGFNEDLQSPTLTPSIKVTSGHYMTGRAEGETCYCTNPDPDFTCSVCHSFVESGKIRFLNDCTHALSGQTVELPEYD